MDLSPTDGPDPAVLFSIVDQRLDSPSGAILVLLYLPSIADDVEAGLGA